MNYIVIETQTSAGVTAIVTPVTYDNLNQAESKWHEIMSAAAVSSVEVHAAFILAEDGRTIMSGCYKHPAEPEVQA